MKKIIKFEKKFCAPCAEVSNYLDAKGVEYDVIKPFENPDQVDMAVEFGIMSVPVTILLDENGEEIIRSTGYKPFELDVIVAKLNE